LPSTPAGEGSRLRTASTGDVRELPTATSPRVGRAGWSSTPRAAPPYTRARMRSIPAGGRLLQQRCLRTSGSRSRGHPA
jgi:hypothetical protein